MSRPNIVWFMADQLRADAVGAFGNPVAQTPAIDALAARGVRFTNAFAQHPVCSPSRVSMMTGWYPHTAGHRSLTSLLKPWEPNLLALMREAGYHVAFPGMRGDVFAPGVTEASTDFCGFLEMPTTIFMPPTYPDGHPRADAFYNGRRPGAGTTLDFDEATVRTFEAWLAAGPPEPWLAFVPLIFPHCPFEAEEPWFSLHARDDMPRPTAPADGKPGFMAALREAYGTDRLDDGDWAEITATYYGMVSRVDHHLERVLAAVDRSGAGERTTTVFCSDHGEYAGDWGLVEKWPSGLDDCLVRNPLVVAGPGVAEGATCTELVEMIDLLPTFLELGEGTAQHTHFGRSLVPVLADPSRPHRDAAFSEGGFLLSETDRLERSGGVYAKKSGLQHEHPELVGRAFAVRTTEWTYIHRLYEADELYDRVGDPNELVNLSGRPHLKDVEHGLRDRLLRWLSETDAPIPWQADPRQPPIPQGWREPPAT